MLALRMIATVYYVSLLSFFYFSHLVATRCLINDDDDEMVE